MILPRFAPMLAPATLRSRGMAYGRFGYGF